MNSAAKNINVQIFVWIYILIYFGYIAKIRIAGSHGNFMFNIFRNCKTIFQRVHHFTFTSNIWSCNLSTSFPTFNHAPPPFFFIMATLVGNPLQCSCLENGRDGRAWWAAIYGVAHSRTWLKRLSSSSRSGCEIVFMVILIGIPLVANDVKASLTSVYSNI